MKQRRFKCAYCDARYIQEKAFLKHTCREKTRSDEFKTIAGQLAWSCYQLWFKVSKRFEPTPDIFLESPMYNHFMHFAHFAKRVQVADVPSYVKIMVKENNIPPSMWTLPDAHAIYLNKLDRLISPLRMVDISIDTLFDLADDYGVPVSDIFNVVKPNEIIILIQRRKLSPWLLLKSKKFVDFYANATAADEKIIMKTLVKFQFWHAKFLKHKKEVEQIKTIVSELNL